MRSIGGPPVQWEIGWNVPTLFIHIGLHKTGSTSIQRTLASLPPADRPCLVGMARSGNAAAVIVGGFRAARHAQTVDPEVRAKLRQRLELDLANAADQDAVISAEAFETLTPAEVADFMGLVRHDKVRVIAYVREPYRLVSSVMQQRIRGLASYINLRPIIINYRWSLEKFEQYGLEMVRFDRRRLLNGCVVQDMMERIGYPIAPAAVIDSNEGLSRTAVALLFMRNRWRRANGLPNASAAALAEDLSATSGPKFRLHRDIVKRHLRHRRADVGWAVERLGEDWLEPYEPAPDDVRSEADLLNIPDSAHSWLEERDEDYVRTNDPYAIGAAVDRIYDRAVAAQESARLKDKGTRRRSAR